MRTTLDIEKPILEGIKKLQQAEKKSLGQIVSALLAEALKERESRSGSTEIPELRWKTAKMGAKVDLSDKDSVYRALEGQ